MHRLRVYVDNSVFGGVFDDEFAPESKLFFERVKTQKYRILVSRINYDEMASAPDRVKKLLRDLPPECLETVTVDDETRELADAYVAGGAIGRAAFFNYIGLYYLFTNRAYTLRFFNNSLHFHKVNYSLNYLFSHL